MLLTFDDNNSSNETVAKSLYELGVQGVFLLNDSPDLERQVETLLKYNQIIGNHTATHRNMARFTPQEFEQEVVRFNKKLESLAGKIEWFSYPYSQRPNNDLVARLKELFPYVLRGSEEPSTCENRTNDMLRLPARLYDFKNNNVILQLHGVEGKTEWDIDNNLWQKILAKLQS